MNNLVAKIKTLFLNRNTVTILAVIAGVIALWFVYSMTLDKAVKPQRVPVAAKTIIAGTIITKDDIEYVEVNSDVLKKASVVVNPAQLVSYYVNNNTSITKGAMFYKDQVVEKSKLVNRDLEIIPEGYRQYWLQVDNATTYANSIYPGDKIDLWLKTEVNNKYVYEEFISNIEVISVKDSKGSNVFDGTEGKNPAWLSFAVDTTMYEYLKKIEYLSGMVLYPVPINKNNEEENAKTEITNTRLVTVIDSLARQVTVDYDVDNKDTKTNTDNTTQNNETNE